MTHPAPGPPTAAVATARATTPHDAAAIARLCSDLIISEPLDTTWLATCRNQFAARLQQGGDARAYVIDAPADGLAACALAFINSVLPAPNYPHGLAGRTYAVTTAPPPAPGVHPGRPHRSSETASGMPCPSTRTWCLLPGRARSTGLGPLWGRVERPGRGWSRSPPETSPAVWPTAAS